MIAVICGGARSGKSAWAVETGLRHGHPVTYVATSPRIDGDDDLAARIAAHQAERPPDWATIEAETELTAALRNADGLVIVDCLTVWVGNMMHHGADETQILQHTAQAIEAAQARSGNTVLVTNEVGLGVVPANDLARTYRDVLGRVNQAWVAHADHSYLLVAGKVLPLHDRPDLFD